MIESNSMGDTSERRAADRRATTSEMWTEVDRRIEERRGSDHLGGTTHFGATVDMGATAGMDTMFGGTTNWLEPSLALTRFSPRSIATEGGPRLFSERVARYGFTSGDLGFLLREGTPSEVLSGMTVYPVPSTPSWMVGLINLRGNLVPVYDMALLAGHEAKPIPQRLMLVLEQGEKAVALLVDSLPRPFRESDAHRLNHVPKIPDRVGAHVQQALLQDDIVWLDFDHTGMVSSLRQEFASVE